MTSLAIGVVASRAGIATSAIRYYKSEGLIPNGCRAFSALLCAAIVRVSTIASAPYAATTNRTEHRSRVCSDLGLRYGTSFPIPTTPLVSDGSTAALYHLNEGRGTNGADGSGNGAAGTIFFGGSLQAGRVCSNDSPSVPNVATLPTSGRPLLTILVAFALWVASKAPWSAAENSATVE